MERNEDERLAKPLISLGYLALFRNFSGVEVSAIEAFALAVGLFLRFLNRVACRLRSFAEPQGHRSLNARTGFVFAFSALRTVPVEVFAEHPDAPNVDHTETQ